MALKRRHYVLYAVVLREHPTIVKIGRTTNWKQRRREYDNWNFADGDGIAKSIIFLITEEFCDLNGLEAECLGTMDAPRVRGAEWFRASIDDAHTVISQVLTDNALTWEETHQS